MARRCLQRARLQRRESGGGSTKEMNGLGGKKTYWKMRWGYLIFVWNNGLVVCVIPFGRFNEKWPNSKSWAEFRVRYWRLNGNYTFKTLAHSASGRIALDKYVLKYPELGNPFCDGPTKWLMKVGSCRIGKTTATHLNSEHDRTLMLLKFFSCSLDNRN